VASPYHPAGEVDTVTGDLGDDAAVRAAVQGCGAIMHLAAMADVNQVVGDPARTDRVNVRGTLALLEAARAEGVGRVLYASTVWVYGNATGEEPLGEDTPLTLPPHFYTATKLAGEMYCRSYEVLYGVASTILRFGIPYGPRARPAAVIPAFIAKARAGAPITIAGDGSQSRQFVYVEDLAEGVVEALAPVTAGRVYNLVGDESVSVRRIADTVRELVADVPVEHGPERPADLAIGLISGARARRDFGWQARTSFSEGVRRYVDWLDADPTGLRQAPVGAQLRPPAVTSGSPAA
jgi:UDP-glucose 4-epimerase